MEKFFLPYGIEVSKGNNYIANGARQLQFDLMSIICHAMPIYTCMPELCSLKLLTMSGSSFNHTLRTRVHKGNASKLNIKKCENICQVNP